MTRATDNKLTPHAKGCLVCGTDCKLIRGLCEKHYRRFTKQMKTIAESDGTEAAEMFESETVRAGWIKEGRQGKRPKDADPFDEIAARVVREFRQEYRGADLVDPEELRQVVEEGDAVIRQTVAEHAAGQLDNLRKKRKSG